MDTVGNFWVQNLRPALDSTAWEPFATFTWLVIDQECVEASPYQKILVCTDAPDYDDFKEDENDPKPTLKILRLALPLFCG